MTAPMICTGRTQSTAGLVGWRAEDADWMVTTEHTLYNAWTMLRWYEEPEVFSVDFYAGDTHSQLLILNLRGQFACVAMHTSMCNAPLLLPCLADERLYTMIAAKCGPMTAYEACEELATELPRHRRPFNVYLRGTVGK